MEHKDTKNKKYKENKKTTVLGRALRATCYMLYGARRESGFTLLEAMLSIFILLVGITGAMSLVSGGITNLTVSKNRLVAINIAQEGLEIVHNIRDTNWLEGADWNDWDGDNIGDGCNPFCNYSLSWDSVVLSEVAAMQDLVWNMAVGHYEGGEGDIRRIITIDDNPDGDAMTPDVRARATVGWGGAGTCSIGGVDSGKKYCVQAEEWLYNWR